ncbi:MAG: cysteine--tRNA ligase [Bacteroidales bacterium]|nr:cysteine--tRNA ligase [Bacteroidales bacterium]
MEHNIKVFNSLTRKKEDFIPLNSPFVGMYVCGPTVYGDPHLGHARPAITFDIIFRYLQHKGYKVRYVRNITDVGHLENDADEGDDKIEKKARLEQLEPMEVAQFYTNRYREFMRKLNLLNPSIEPQASGHIPEQIEMVKKIIDNGFAYESNGSVYFDVNKYSKLHNYGILSGRNIDELFSNTRALDGQDEKQNPADFAIWKKASPTHIMRWKSPWSDGVPGWHMECSAMGAKYLGNTFDIHGGGMDLLFPHHESEIAQSVAANNVQPAKYWIHNNMITINGKKMGKSLGNFITLEEFFNGSHEMLKQAYSPMTIRFFILQAHYRGTLDFSNEALIAAEKAFDRLMTAFDKLDSVKIGTAGETDTAKIIENCYAAMDDDFNTPIAIANIFEAAKFINATIDKQASMSAEQKSDLQKIKTVFIENILGLKSSTAETKGNKNIEDDLMKMIVDLRLKYRQEKDFKMSDFIRDELIKIGIELKDTKEGTEWTINK